MFVLCCWFLLLFEGLIHRIDESLFFSSWIFLCLKLTTWSRHDIILVFPHFFCLFLTFLTTFLSQLWHTVQGFFISQIYTFCLFLAFSYVQNTPGLFVAFGFAYQVSGVCDVFLFVFIKLLVFVIC